MSPGLILEKYRKNIESIDQITRIGSDVSEILLVLLKSLEKENEKIPGFILYKEKLERVIGEIEKIKNHPSLKDKYEVIYNQANVLLVSNLESSLTDLVITIVNEYHDIIQWPKEDKKIVFEVSVLNYKFPTLGEVIMKSLGVEFNFQDLQSTLRFFEEYLKINLKIDDEIKDNIIKYQALRHVIVHSFSKIDERYLKQMRNTKFAKNHPIGTKIKLNEEDYKKAREVFEKLFLSLIDKINTEIKNLYGEEFLKEITQN